MANGQRHIDDNGNIGTCRVTTGICPFAGRGHFDSREEAEAAYGALQSEGSVPSSLKRSRDPKTVGFGIDSFYGEMPPRTIQIDALNETANALLEDGNTQLVAACGTGKSYMGRQLMRRMMEEEDANGVAIVLTSSRKLAIDTAADLRPGNGGYDAALGVYEKDYSVEVIEIHSDSKDGIKENGAVSPDKIAERWTQALDAGKKVVIVSTYQSSSKVQEVQKLIGERATADLLMNDEAHNILGQKDSLSSDEAAKNSGYRSFANEIPGSIQSKHRLYATATPPLADSPDDDESSAQGETRAEQIEALKGQVESMGANGRKRLTVYSDDELIVGRVSGAITQQEAISEGYLTKPDYQLRAAVVRGDSSVGGFVDHTGSYIAGSESADGPRSMTPQTYAAVSSTLQAMASDPTSEDGKLKNPTHNALVYAGSIDQARAFRDNFRAVAIEQSGGMSLEEAERNRDSADPELKRRARMKLLAENAEAVAAYSGENREVKAERERAFGMFRGKSFTAEDAQRGWSPDKRVLANVDIFSEGISLNEIDTVVIADSAKTSERAMTQAIGRSLRTVGGNDQKNTGHVIIPQVLDEKSRELNGGLVTAASYGATRVERAVSTRKLKGETVAADNATRVSRFDASGRRVDSELASSIAKTHVQSAEKLLASQVMERAHTSLLAKTSPEKRREAERYSKLSASEKLQAQRTFIEEQSKKAKDPSWSVAHNALQDVANSDMPTLRQSGRVVTAALSAGDFSAVPSTVADRLSRAGVIRKRQGAAADGPTLSEKREFALKSSKAVAAAFMLKGGQDAHPDVAAVLATGVDTREAAKYHTTGGKSGSAAEFNKLVSNYESLVNSNDSAMEKIFGSIEESADGSKSTLANVIMQKQGTAIKDSVKALRKQSADRAAAAAISGSAEYELDPSMVMRNGVLKSSTQRLLAESILTQS